MKKMPKRKGSVIVISGPSGVGKTTISEKLLKSLPALRYSVSFTTRKPRRGEIHGKDYFFVSENEFREMISKKQFAEWACVHGHHYGTSRQFLEKTIAAGNDIYLDIDVQGSKKIKKVYPDANFIFVLPPSISVLEKRLHKRAKDSEKVIRKRIKNAEKEIREAPGYDYLVVNDNLVSALKQLKRIITDKIGKKQKGGKG